MVASPARFDVTRLGPVLEELHERWRSVVIERLPYATFIDKYDRPGTLFYLDPPYWGCETDYGNSFARGDFECLAEQLAGSAGVHPVDQRHAWCARGLRPVRARAGRDDLRSARR
jgi:DNA adenine methylase